MSANLYLRSNLLNLMFAKYTAYTVFAVPRIKNFHKLGRKICVPTTKPYKVC